MKSHVVKSSKLFILKKTHISVIVFIYLKTIVQLLNHLNFPSCLQFKVFNVDILNIKYMFIRDEIETNMVSSFQLIN